jgi:hypothetical protein
MDLVAGRTDCVSQKSWPHREAGQAPGFCKRRAYAVIVASLVLIVIAVQPHDSAGSP